MIEKKKTPNKFKEDAASVLAQKLGIGIEIAKERVRRESAEKEAKAAKRAACRKPVLTVTPKDEPEETPKE